MKNIEKYDFYKNQFKNELLSHKIVSQDWVMKWFKRETNRILNLTGPVGSGKNYIGQKAFAQWVYHTDFRNDEGILPADGKLIVMAKRRNRLRDAEFLWREFYRSWGISEQFVVKQDEWYMPNKFSGSIRVFPFVYGEQGQASKAGDVQGSNAFGIFIDEAANLNGEVRDQLILRLGRNFEHFKVIMVSNPGQPHDEYQKNFLDVELEIQKDYVILPIDANPGIKNMDQFIGNILSVSRQENQIKNNLLGIPAGTGGLVFDNPKRYYSSRECPPEWPRIGGIDYGWGESGVTAGVIIAFNPLTKEAHVEKEYVMKMKETGKLSDEDQAERLITNLGDDVIFWVIDGRAQLKGYVDNLSKRDVQVNKIAKKKVSQEQFQTALVRDILTIGHCPNLKEEMEAWQYKDKTDEDINEEPEILKKNDHVIDATRYALEWIVQIFDEEGVTIE